MKEHKFCAGCKQKITGGKKFHIEDYDMLKTLSDRVKIKFDDSELPEYYIEPNGFKEMLVDEAKMLAEMHLRMMQRRPE